MSPGSCSGVATQQRQRPREVDLGGSADGGGQGQPQGSQLGLPSSLLPPHQLAHPVAAGLHKQMCSEELFGVIRHNHHLTQEQMQLRSQGGWASLRIRGEFRHLCLTYLWSCVELYNV